MRRREGVGAGGGGRGRAGGAGGGPEAGRRAARLHPGTPTARCSRRRTRSTTCGSTGRSSRTASRCTSRRGPIRSSRPGTERDDKDKRLAKMISAAMDQSLADAFAKAYGDRLTTSLEKGDIVVEGRVVDCSTGSTATKVLVGFGAGSGNTTIDVRFVDAATGEGARGLPPPRGQRHDVVDHRLQVLQLARGRDRRAGQEGLHQGLRQGQEGQGLTSAAFVV